MDAFLLINIPSSDTVQRLSVEHKTVGARVDTWFTSDCADLIEVRVFSKTSYLYDAQHTQARAHNCDSFRRREKAVDMLNHTWAQPIWNNLRSHYLRQETLSIVGVSVSDYFCSSPRTHFWSFSGCAAAKIKSRKHTWKYTTAICGIVA